MDSLLQEMFSTGRLVRPLPEEPDVIHLIRALATLCGLQEFGHMPATRRLIELIGMADHYVFVLLDGLGMNIVRRLPTDSFLRRHLRAQISAGCPSTTACALTSVATGQWASEHAVTGWFTYVPDRDLSVVVLPFTERFTQERLSARGLKPEDILPVAGFQSRLPRRTMTFLPTPIAHTPYAEYSRAHTSACGYESIPDAIDQTIAHVANQPEKEKTYTHLYIPDVDTFSHHNGVQHPKVTELLELLDAQLTRLTSALSGRARIIISADHGLIDVPVENHMTLFHDDPLLKLLRVPPSGDARMPVFHVRDEQHRQFAEKFEQRFGHSMILLPTNEADEMRMFGPQRLSPIARQRFGDFIGLACRPATLHWVPPRRAPETEPKKVYVAQHAGLSPDEMEVPLIVA